MLSHTQTDTVSLELHDQLVTICHTQGFAAIYAAIQALTVADLSHLPQRGHQLVRHIYTNDLLLIAERPLLLFYLLKHPSYQHYLPDMLKYPEIMYDRALHPLLIECMSADHQSAMWPVLYQANKLMPRADMGLIPDVLFSIKKAPLLIHFIDYCYQQESSEHGVQVRSHHINMAIGRLGAHQSTLRTKQYGYLFMLDGDLAKLAQLRIEMIGIQKSALPETASGFGSFFSFSRNKASEYKHVQAEHASLMQAMHQKIDQQVLQLRPRNR